LQEGRWQKLATGVDKEAPEIVLFPHAEAVLKATGRKIVLVREEKERDFVKVYTAEIRRACYPSSSRLLDCDEAALFFYLMAYLDYETNVVLSPKQCFDQSGERLRSPAIPASIKDIIEVSGRTKPTVLKTLVSLEKKGLIKRVALDDRDKRRKAIVLSPHVVFKGGQKQATLRANNWEEVSFGEKAEGLE